MRRSGDITAAAIVLFFGSGFIILLGLLVAFSVLTTQSQTQPTSVLFMLFVAYALPSAWGIATGVGILQLRPWARISMLIMSGAAIFFGVFGALGLAMVPMIVRQNPDVSPAAVRFVIAVGVAMLLVPLAIAIWWLILFARKRVVLEFATRGAGAPVLTVPVHENAMAPGIAPRFAAPTSPQIPLSIRIIAIFFLIGSGIVFPSLVYSIQLNMPTLLLGKLVEGWPAWVFLGLLGLVQGAICIAVLRKSAWALDGLIACVLFGIANTAMMELSPSRTVFFERITRAESLPPNVSVDLMREMMGRIFAVSIGLGAILSFVMLYFLFTRRRAFRAACAARPGAAQ